MTRTKRRGIAAVRHGGLRRKRWHRRVAVVSVVVLAASAGTALVYWAWPHTALYRPVAAVSEGHGRGMSQVGAFGQSQAGASAESILTHYYPGAQPATIAPTMVRVRLMNDDNETLDVYSDSGLKVADQRVVPGQVAHLTPTATGADVTITTGCSGDVLWRGATDNPWAYPVDPGPDRPAAEHLKICGAGTYRGALGVALDGADMRTVNEVDTEDYLRGVVPTEMSADWADQGGSAALRAQAIAARSYALAETRYPYAQTCDTQDCQAYSGTEREDSRSDAAVRDTVGQVLLRDGRLLRSEYSSAPNGGHPIDINTLAVGPTPAELTTAVSASPSDPRDDGAQRASAGPSAVDFSTLLQLAPAPSAAPGPDAVVAQSPPVGPNSAASAASAVPGPGAVVAQNSPVAPDPVSAAPPATPELNPGSGRAAAPDPAAPGAAAQG